MSDDDKSDIQKFAEDLKELIDDGDFVLIESTSRNTAQLSADISPFTSYLKVLKAFLKTGGCFCGCGELPDDLVRVESVSAGAGECRVVLYPSDALLNFGAALVAGNRDD